MWRNHGDLFEVGPEVGTGHWQHFHLEGAREQTGVDGTIAMFDDANRIWTWRPGSPPQRTAVPVRGQPVNATLLPGRRALVDTVLDGEPLIEVFTTEGERLWRRELTVTTFLVLEDGAFVCHGNGDAICLESEDGRERWRRSPRGESPPR